MAADHTVPTNERLGAPSLLGSTLHKFQPFFENVVIPDACFSRVTSPTGHKLDTTKKKAAKLAAGSYCDNGTFWSGREDSNLRPHGPEPL